MNVVAHNLMAMNANRQYNITKKSKTKSSEKLSSGYQINRASDDAAGLAISEKMRRQIRGLDQGMRNISDGISLCQVADGALDEVTNILQRVRELSIQAYNGTNSETDRQCIQDEVDQCLTEVDRIKESTKFNEIQILKNGNEKVTETKTVTTTVTVQKSREVLHTTYKEAPAWLSDNVDQNFEVHTSYTNPQDTDGVMLQSYPKTDGSYVNLYFGADKGNKYNGTSYTYFGDYVSDTSNSAELADLRSKTPNLDAYINQLVANGNLTQVNTTLPDGTTQTTYTNYSGWTPDISDNSSAKIDFSGLQSSTDAADLYENMFNLLGTSLNIPCGSCQKYSGVHFIGALKDEITKITFKSMYMYQSSNNINITDNPFEFDGQTFTGYFAAIDYVARLEEKEAADGTLGRPDGQTAANLLTSLSEDISKDLAKRVYEGLSSNSSFTSHFDRIVDYTPGDTGFIVYDYRDDGALKAAGATAADISLYSWISYAETEFYDETYTESHEETNTYTTYVGVNIQASGEVGDSIPIELSAVSQDSLGLRGYSVSKYTTETYVTNQAEYDIEQLRWQQENDAYERKLREWENNRPFDYITSTQTVTIRKILKLAEREPIYENGEQKGYRTLKPAEWQDITVTMPITTIQYRNDPDYEKLKPQPPAPPSVTLQYATKRYYDPSDLDILDRAMAKVSDLRSYFGAMQNRLEHAYQVNANTSENTQASESVIRDTDMAEEMVAFSKANILESVGQSMLAQANQSNQYILSLLG